VGHGVGSCSNQGPRLARTRDTAAYVGESRLNIQRAFADLSIFQRTRELAIYHYCAVLEVESYKTAASQEKLFSAGRSAVESGIRAVPALFERCVPGATDPQIDQALFLEAYELFIFSRAYEQVEYSLALADKGQFEIHVAKHDPRITLTYAAAESAATDTFRRSSEILERSGLSQPSAVVEEGLAIVIEVRNCLDRGIRFTSPDHISYEYTADLSSLVARWAKFLETQLRWELSPAIVLGAISLAELRRFWAAVLAISNTHDLAHLSASGGDCRKWPIGSRVNLRTREEWVRILSAISGLSTQVTATGLGWLTFDARISPKTPMLQPFLEILPDQLCVPSLFLITNNFERNFLRLLHRHPALLQYADAINTSKEPLALAEVSALFPGPAYRTKPQVRIPTTDADLVIYEAATGWALVVQHKWLVGPDTANESAANDDELVKGVKQGVLVRDYWRKEPGHLRNSLSLSADAPITNIEACVVCRGADATGFLSAPAIPVITETAFVSLLDRGGGLPSLWKLLSDRPDLAEAAGRFKDVRCTIPLAGYEFVLPYLVM
jgi:hypothetical protein